MRIIDVINKIPEVISCVVLLLQTLTLKRVERIEKREDGKIKELKEIVEKQKEDINILKIEIAILQNNYERSNK
mgnify:CR=1 FL=1